MTVFGIPFRKPDQKDLLVISLIILGMLAINITLADAIEVKPQTLLACTMAGASGGLLSASGIRGSEGKKQLLIISITALIFGMFGHFLGVYLLKLIAG
ncbi:hypothetical protein [Microbulbifer sp. THAF38]|uniref:hypothetical protein n=1 Tax=Microbulbifer sp. THAF38 TaxID=2587856 RepID=UPI001268F06C|nr:hypothetical protein [Microbulbifer sp. THAF38]QFT57071.1 hypothetical protein FIU95_21200 [Microbulbifer sp. THAF38]